nr:hypothetical protein BgiMline_014318 [Biomphalaria glabrata]
MNAHVPWRILQPAWCDLRSCVLTLRLAEVQTFISLAQHRTVDSLILNDVRLQKLGKKRAVDKVLILDTRTNGLVLSASRVLWSTFRYVMFISGELTNTDVPDSSLRIRLQKHIRHRQSS